MESPFPRLLLLIVVTILSIYLPLATTWLALVLDVFCWCWCCCSCLATDEKDFTNLYLQAEECKSQAWTVKGARLRMGELQHFDVLVRGESALGQELARKLQVDLVLNCARDMELLRLERESQHVTEEKEVWVRFGGGTDLEQQALILRQVFWCGVGYCGAVVYIRLHM